MIPADLARDPASRLHCSGQAVERDGVYRRPENPVMKPEPGLSQARTGRAP